jgi:hypothetical protein
MNHRSLVAQRHGTTRDRSHSAEVLPVDPRDPGDDFLRQEIESNRRSERWLVLKGLIALLLVAVLVAIRQVFFT